MQKELKLSISLDNYLGCFGGFNFYDAICKKFCALNVRCAIEEEQNARIELLDELISNDSVLMKIQ